MGRKLTLSGGLLCVNWLHIAILRAMIHTRVHPIHRLLLVTLLRTLTHHHGSYSSSRAGISIDTRHRSSVTVSLWHELGLAIRRIHHLRSRCHTLRSHECAIWIWHHDWTHVTLGRHELLTLRQRAVLSLHWWSAWELHHLRVIRHLSRLPHW